MEACSGAHFFAAKLRNQGHEVRLIPGQFVKPFVKTNKNDFNDAEAIAEAVTRQNYHVVAHGKAVQSGSAAAHVRQGLNLLLRVRFLQSCNDDTRPFVAIGFGEARMPLFFGRARRHAITFFAHGADQHGDMFGDLRSSVEERTHIDHLAVDAR